MEVRWEQGRAEADTAVCRAGGVPGVRRSLNAQLSHSPAAPSPLRPRPGPRCPGGRPQSSASQSAWQQGAATWSGNPRVSQSWQPGAAPACQGGSPGFLHRGLGGPQGGEGSGWSTRARQKEPRLTGRSQPRSCTAHTPRTFCPIQGPQNPHGGRDASFPPAPPSAQAHWELDGPLDHRSPHGSWHCTCVAQDTLRERLVSRPLGPLLGSLGCLIACFPPCD